MKCRKSVFDRRIFKENVSPFPVRSDVVVENRLHWMLLMDQLFFLLSKECRNMLLGIKWRISPRLESNNFSSSIFLMFSFPSTNSCKVRHPHLSLNFRSGSSYYHSQNTEVIFYLILTLSLWVWWNNWIKRINTAEFNWSANKRIFENCQCTVNKDCR